MTKRLILLLSLFGISIFFVGSVSGGTEPITITILYDNYALAPGTQSDHGFSCLIQGTEKTILFDAGTNPDILYHNIETLDIDIHDVELIAISHEHEDHTGALERLMKEKPGLPVYHPLSFSKRFVTSVQGAGARSIPVDQPIEICKDVYLTGEMGDEIREQSLILKTAEGLVVITGCSHPGIVEILERANEILDEEIYFVGGGFHLNRHSDEAVHEIIRRFKELGVKKCSPTHCTGDRQIELFKKAYGENCVRAGVGKVMTFGKTP